MPKSRYAVDCEAPGAKIRGSVALGLALVLPAFFLSAVFVVTSVGPLVLQDALEPLARLAHRIELRSKPIAH